MKTGDLAFDKYCINTKLFLFLGKISVKSGTPIRFAEDLTFVFVFVSLAKTFVKSIVNFGVLLTLPAVATNCLSVFDHFVGLAGKELNYLSQYPLHHSIKYTQLLRITC